MNEYITIPEYAKIVGITVQHAYKVAKSDKLSSYVTEKEINGKKKIVISTEALSGYDIASSNLNDNDNIKDDNQNADLVALLQDDNAFLKEQIKKLQEENQKLQSRNAELTESLMTALTQAQELHKNHQVLVLHQNKLLTENVEADTAGSETQSQAKHWWQFWL